MGLMVLLVVTLALASPAFAQDVPKIDVNISSDEGGSVWYKNPIIVGGGVVLLFLLVALAGRGSGTTVVKS